MCQGPEGNSQIVASFERPPLAYQTHPQPYNLCLPCLPFPHQHDYHSALWWSSCFLKLGNTSNKKGDEHGPCPLHIPLLRTATRNIYCESLQGVAKSFAWSFSCYWWNLTCYFVLARNESPTCFNTSLIFSSVLITRNSKQMLSKSNLEWAPTSGHSAQAATWALAVPAVTTWALAVPAVTT